jgi:AdoMet-dependent rRNA methyltransferase SPB1
VDLLPIKAIRNVKTIVADITTAECRKEIAQELNGWKADVVLCDGAPNIGSAYTKDAYVQNELVLAALKTATDHLVEGGSFCTKVYRSQDYNAVVWVLQQLFEDVQAMKPNSSRSQSSEIFLVCMKYTAPKSIDPKLLDPNHVFKEVRDPGLAKIDVMHKKYEQHNKRHRTGYDEDAGILLTTSKPVSSFIQSKDPIRMLTDVNTFVFTEGCEPFKTHPLTTEEIKTCLNDLRVLGRIDFKKLLKWRLQMRKQVLNLDGSDKKPSDVVSNASSKRSWNIAATDDEIQEEIMKAREHLEARARKEKKSTREKMAKERNRLALGINSNSFGVDDDMELFSLPTNIRESQIDGITEVDLESNEAAAMVALSDEDEGDADHTLAGQSLKSGKRKDELIQGDENLENQLAEDYVRYLQGSKKARKGEEGVETKSQKKARLANTSDAITTRKAQEDEELEESLGRSGGAPGLSEDLLEYAKMLSGKAPKSKAKARKGKGASADAESSSSSDSDSEDEEEEGGVGGHANDDDDDDAVSIELEDDEAVDFDSLADKVIAKRGKKQQLEKNAAAAPVDRVMSSVQQLSDSSKVSKWFSHPLFSEALMTSKDTGKGDAGSKKRKAPAGPSTEEDGADAQGGAEGDNVEDAVMSMMPKTDKEMRREKRKKAEERKQRREEKKARRHPGLDDEEDEEGGGGRAGSKGGFEIAPAVKFDENDMVIDEKTYQKREIIRQGLGKQLNADKSASASSNIEIVPSSSSGGKVPSGLDDFFVRHDPRTYDSDSEDYDKNDRAMTLALGTMMLRKSKQKALVDASYNRFAWNDPGDLPSWFVDDEMKHNKPQVPVPSALLDQIKGKYQNVGTKEIKKVAEARARKRKRAMVKLKAAKKQANALAENSELSEKQKLKAIAKAMRGSKMDKNSGKVYVFTKRTKSGSMGTSSGAKVLINSAVHICDMLVTYFSCLFIVREN